MNPNEQNNNQISQLANVGPAAPASQSANQPPLMNPKKSNKIVVWLVVAVLLVMATMASVFFMIKDNDDSKTTNTNNSSSVQNNNSNNESNSSNSSSYEALAAKARNLERTTDIKALHFSLEEYSSGSGAGYYPSLSQMNDTSWLSKNMPGLIASSLRDPSSSATVNKLKGAAPTEVGEYSYLTEPSNCTGATGSTPCTGYKVSAYLENGEGIYSKEDLQ